ncbi:amino acid/amide ABC transporter ATP-binding protein 2 (HAAT family) [Variovorax beijingensis]|uniref:Branched-chain amino acid transport system ATP-binding protein n=2 Tax=Variovorax TaxID=34072 RepID=A0AAE4C079_VARPD|nr:MULTISPECIES: ABC transporter ATP-binding protein [Variovorax]MBD9667282.1 ABC transporter ATP-binding protein [Variovorax sp. VRV01]MDR6428959.1 branched-chain amino acid transport system ATP-binding protein [Variovorax paradoxus]MDR6455715.1 branched-chain amino acid transport system ATP-binding protein [Variovorax paradoxus]TWD77056.1 amino acid/amide ABC transporter ATP-binding protein 2 (HAAT family) [Variovorax beijingensis]
MPKPTIELRFDDVTAGYGGLPVLEHLSFSVREGERLGLIGRNGAGKTTTLATAMGLADLMKGRIHFGGDDISNASTYARSRAGLGYVPQSRDIFPSLTVEENLLAGLQGRSASVALPPIYALFPRLKERRRNGGTQLSGGEQQMLSVARALVGQPRILLLDEPLEGLAPMVREELMDAIVRMSDQLGVGCIIVEQHVDVVLEFSNNMIVLERGLAAYSGSAAVLSGEEALLNRTIGIQKC